MKEADVQMKNIWFLMLLVIFVAGCSAKQSLLDGIVLYKEKLPEAGSVSFTNEAGETATALAYPGFINIYAEINTDETVVKNAVAAAQGAIVSAIPKVGIYIAKVEVGQESAFISAMRQQKWVVDAYPLIQLTPYEVNIFDYFSLFNPNSDCTREHSHGDVVLAVAEKNSETQIYEMGNFPTSTDYLARIMREMEGPVRDTPKVFSFSFGSAAENTVTDEEVRTGCPTINCQTARDAEKNFLRSFYHLMEAEIEFNPAAADKAMFVFAMGNRGLDVDIEIKELQAAYPRAAKRIKLVGSSTSDGQITRTRNYAKDDNNNVVYAQGERKRVSMPDNRELICTGTSFSTPEVSGVLDYVWSQNPDLSSEQLMRAFDEALLEYKTRVVPHDSNGDTDQSFIDRVVEIAAGKDKEAKEPSEKEKGSDQTTASGRCASPFDGRWTGTFNAELTYTWLANEPTGINTYEGKNTESLTASFTLSCVELVKPADSYADYPNGYYILELSAFSSGYPPFECASGCEISTGQSLPDGKKTNWIFIGLGPTQGAYSKMMGTPVIFKGDNQAVDPFLSLGETTTVNPSAISLSTAWSKDNSQVINAWDASDKGMNLLLCQKEDLNPENQWYGICLSKSYSYVLRKQ